MPGLQIAPAGSGSLRDGGTFSAGTRTESGTSSLAKQVFDSFLDAINVVVRDNNSTYWSRLLVHQPQTPTWLAGPTIDAVDARLTEIGNLADGWMNGDGVAPRQESLDLARSVLFQALGFALPRPRLFVTYTGEVEAEWTRGTIEMSVVFDPDAPTLDAIAVNSQTGFTREAAIPVGRPDLLNKFVQQPQV